MAKSLLAHLYTHIKGSQEDIATISLQYILAQSEELNRAFTKRLASSLKIEFDAQLQYVCQTVGENRERPDMSGLDTLGNELVLCEMKFYAGLTQNQPLGYIDRLKQGKGRGMVFICPVRRQQTLWFKLKESCEERSISHISEYCIEVDGIRLTLVTWAEILELLTKVASSVAVEYLADIRQLEGFCAQMDSEAFIPFTDDDLRADIAIKADRYYEVIDKTIELFRTDESLSTSAKGIKATAYRKGYTRSLYVDEFTFTLNYDRDLWKNDTSIETPFWVAVRDGDWDQTEEMVAICRKYPQHLREDNFWNMCFLALQPLKDASLLEVCEDLKKQILDYIEEIRNNLR